MKRQRSRSNFLFTTTTTTTWCTIKNISLDNISFENPALWLDNLYINGVTEYITPHFVVLMLN